MTAVALALLILTTATGLDLSSIDARIDAGQWRKADRAWRAEAERLAASPRTDNEEASVLKLMVARAVISAGSGNARHANWYWSIAEMYGPRPSLEEVAEQYAGAGATLAAMIEPPPPLYQPSATAEPSGPPRVVSERSERIRAPSPSGLFRVACADQTGMVSMRTRRDAQGYHRAPRRAGTKDGEPSPRPLCAVAVMDEFRDQVLPGPEGMATTIHRPVRPFTRR